MELWATGFNAWNQLQDDGGDLTSNPEDIHEFKCILQDEVLDVLRTSLSSILGKSSDLYREAPWHVICLPFRTHLSLTLQSRNMRYISGIRINYVFSFYYDLTVSSENLLRTQNPRISRSPAIPLPRTARFIPSPHHSRQRNTRR